MNKIIFKAFGIALFGFIFSLIAYDIQHLNRIKELNKQNNEFDNTYKKNFSNYLNNQKLDLKNIKGDELSGKNLQYANFAYADFSGSILKNINFIGANLDHASFRNAELNSVIFNGYLFGENTVKNYANVKYIDFQNARLINLDLSGLDFYGCTFKDAKFINIIVDKNTNFDGSTVDQVSFESVSGEINEKNLQYLKKYNATNIKVKVIKIEEKPV